LRQARLAAIERLGAQAGKHQQIIVFTYRLRSFAPPRRAYSWGCRWTANVTKGEGSPMSSMFTWVDFAEDDRRKMADAIALFSEKDTRDELGLGGIRDTFADLLFPATAPFRPGRVISCSSRGFTRSSNAAARCPPISNGSRDATRFA
jgi:Family of unknown function (DUF6361)